MEYRKSLGGEEAIMEYCHELAVKGGEAAAKILGTEVMENAERSLTVAMVNVRIPLKNPGLSDAQVINLFIDKLLYEHNCMAPVYKHNNIWYTRFSAQVYNDVSDFELVANAILAVCKELEQ
jgi:selenocysteine lyase/cysteine desulfurase